jgi:hypothetical protein
LSFPVLAYAPRHEFVLRCLDHFIHVLQIQQMIDELNELRASIGPNDLDSESVTDRIISLQRDIQNQVSLRDVEDIALAEEAAEIRRVGRRPDLPLPSLERVRESA